MQRYCFQTEGVNCLNKLYETYEYDIIISSTRRYEFDVFQWNLIFSFNDIKASVIDVTPKLLYSNLREDEIQSIHDKKYKDRPFLVIDDDMFDLHTLEDKLIHVEQKSGLTENYLYDMIEKIKRQIK